MKRRPKQIKHSPHNGFKVKADASRNYHLYQPILDNTFYQLDAMLDKHCKVFTFRFDLHLPDDFNDSEKNLSTLVSKLFNAVTGHLKKTPKKARSQQSLRNHKNVSYQWCIEYAKKEKHHVHCWIAVNGAINQRTGWVETEHSPGSGLVGLIESKWKNLTGGTLFLVHSERTLTRTNRKLYEECINHYSYLSKTKGKYLASTSKYLRL